MRGILIAAAILAALWLLERALRAHTKKKFKPAGQFVDVNGRKMHVRVYGEGARTIVFLPGLGTASPDADFLPLTRRLTEYRCVVPEPLGYGFSDDTDTPRTVEHIVDEVRAGLSAAGIRPPYLLLGHSVAGLYIRWWACRYPGEIAGLIGDDPSLPEQVDVPEISSHLPDHGVMLALFKFGGALNRLFGLGRLRTRLFPAEAFYMTGGDMSLLPLTPRGRIVPRLPLPDVRGQRRGQLRRDDVQKRLFLGAGARGNRRSCGEASLCDAAGRALHSLDVPRPHGRGDSGVLSCGITSMQKRFAWNVHAKRFWLVGKIFPPGRRTGSPLFPSPPLSFFPCFQPSSTSFAQARSSCRLADERNTLPGSRRLFGQLGCNFSFVWPMPLPPEVAKGTIVFPVRS